jgi:hypothetical protein
LSCYDPQSDSAANRVRIRACGEVRDAMADDNWRFDASDLMPGAIGSLDTDGTPGALFEGMIDYAEQDGAGLDEILADIDGAWP